jgi:hypothetical protein
MKTFNVTLTKSYLVRIQAENEEMAKDFSEFYSSDIKDISNDKEREDNRFKILDIRSTLNQAFDVKETIYDES